MTEFQRCERKLSLNMLRVLQGWEVIHQTVPDIPHHYANQRFLAAGEQSLQITSIQWCQIVVIKINNET